jgi:hypothetical protein
MTIFIFFTIFCHNLPSPKPIGSSKPDLARVITFFSVYIFSFLSLWAWRLFILAQSYSWRRPTLLMSGHLKLARGVVCPFLELIHDLVLALPLRAKGSSIISNKMFALHETRLSCSLHTIDHQLSVGQSYLVNHHCPSINIDLLITVSRITSNLHLDKSSRNTRQFFQKPKQNMSAPLARGIVGLGDGIRRCGC